jgi:hypothetical protein
MMVIGVPYHPDEHLADLGFPLSAEVAGALRLLLDSGRVTAVGIACTWHPGHAGAYAVGPQLEAALAIQA